MFSSFEDHWLSSYEHSDILISVLIPNGLIINIKVYPETTFLELKEEVFDLAQTLPLFGALQNKQTYICSCVNFTTAEPEELDESRKIADVQPFLKIVRLIEKRDDMASKQLNAQIGFLIGKSLHEFEALKNPEINDFRWRARVLCESIQELRIDKSWIEKVNYQYPLRVEKDSLIPFYLQNYLKQDEIVLELRFETSKMSHRFRFNCFSNCDKAINKAIKRFNYNQTDSSKFFLKVTGQEDYLFGDYPLIQYKYIRECIARSLVPSLIIVSIVNMNIDESDNSLKKKGGRSGFSTTFSNKTLHKRNSPISSSNIKEKLYVTVNCCSKLNQSQHSRIAVKIGLFHGRESLTLPISTVDKEVKEDKCIWNERCIFDLNVCDVPRMARFCFVIYEVLIRPRKNSHGKLFKPTLNCETNALPLKWVNTPVFDYKNILKTGSVTFPMWKYPPDFESEDILNPLGTVMPNPNGEDETCLTITFAKYNDLEIPIIYQPIEPIKKRFKIDINQTHEPRQKSKYFEDLKKIVEKNPLLEMSEQDKELVWYFRNDCLKYLPQSLPHLLNSVKWNNQNYVAEILDLIQNWQLVKPEKALELLDYSYPDVQVRKFAIKCLKKINDEDVLLYLLQLVQAIKYESYLYCDLTIFLIEKALTNQIIGNNFFWLLKSEMNEASTTIYFGLILEVYCRGAIIHMKSLTKQMKLVNKLKQMNEFIKKKIISRKDGKEKIISTMQQMLEQSYYKDAFKNVTIPLDPRVRLKDIKIDKCKLMDSKMKPLWLVFKNTDFGAEDISIIFKSGDDLRQDMLTLQMIRIMDKLWKDEGLDFQMSPYHVIATEYNIGLIQVVLSTQTLAKIQKLNSLKATSAFNKASLLNWLKAQNPDEDILNQAISRFTLSCAGYCVATYVLGVADRHSDNILIKTNGQMLHIDFGHILGRFKEKFGIKRERVPFVLTNDFVYVITKGGTQKNQFLKFQKYCEQAFVILRRKGSFIISLFSMMLSTGLPQLSSNKDLEYLRETLVLDLSESEAIQHFKSKFNEALKNSWKTNINWLAHNIAKDNG